MDPFWIYFASFIALLACLPVADWCRGRRYGRAVLPVLVVGLLAAVVLFTKGVSMASDWTVFSVDTSGLHNPKARLVGSLLPYWPYVVMAYSGFLGFCIMVVLKRGLKSRRSVTR
ncbi:hypothetical protein FG93_03513 [Bosea sp. LC85]|uniref:hypothetical protein n=1 Tax=Bosea sp. LC85 TaxID=1502851 RepID=UPI0004E2ADEC|nr:hypothetical protein [Bosea sp. LC85]KFC68891.1 hypothetical protein FG93_03513 [Bosea sp. LC85]